MSIDNHWVGPAGQRRNRHVVRRHTGGLLHTVCEIPLRHLVSVFIGVVMAVFYFTITLAFHQFHLFNQTSLFCNTDSNYLFLGNIIPSLWQAGTCRNSFLVGSMSNFPFIVDTRNANYNALFIYFIILNAGLLVIAYYKAWRILNISAFALTVLVLTGVIYTLPGKSAGISFIYISILYLVFFLINIANNIKENKTLLLRILLYCWLIQHYLCRAGLYLLTVMHNEQLRETFLHQHRRSNLFILFYII